jgi:hypothetical protein
VQQRTHARQILPPPSIGEQAVVADAVKAERQHMQQEVAHELVRLQAHELVARASLGPVILPAEGDFVPCQRHEARVGDGYSVGVTGQVSQYRFGSGKRALGIHHPFAGAQRRQPRRKGLWRRQCGMLAEES